MSVSQVGAATGTTSATVPAHAIGDLIIIFAYRSGSTTAPTLGAGFKSIRTQAGTTCSASIGFKIATSTSDTSGTWTNASHLTCLVYRSSNYATGSSLYIGGSASTSSTTTTVNYPALTMTHADNTSWAIGFAGTSVATAALSTHAPAGMTFFTNSDVTATTEVCAFDTNGTVSSWASTNTTVSAAGNSVSATVELIENQPGSAIANIVQHIATAYTNSNATGETGDLFVSGVFDYLTGNALVVGVNYQIGVTPVITDNKSTTWPIVGSANVITVTGGGMATSVFVLASPAAGTNQITISLGGNPQAMVSFWIDQLFNVTATVEGSVTAASVAVTTGIISPGSFTPAAANCLILAYLCADASTGVTTNPALIVPETGYALNDADISWGAAGIPKASQFTLQTTAVATTPRFYLNAPGTVDTYNVLALALSTGSQGTAKPSGAGVAPWIDRICFFGTNSAPASWFLQTPGSGNAAAFMSSFQGTGTPDWTAVSDNDGVSWTAQNPTAGAPTPFTRVNSSARLSRTATVTIGNNAAQNFFAVYYDISNCATSPIVRTAGVGSTGASNVNSIAGQPSITPTAINQLTLNYMGIGVGPSIGITAPSGANYDLPTYSVAKVTATIAGTTLTVSATAWGSIGSGNVVSGAGVTLGTTIQSGAGPTFTIQPSQTVSVGETMLISSSDVTPMNWGNAAGHYFNGGSTAAQNWTWSISNQPSSSVLATALIFAGPPAAGAGPNNQFDWPNPRPPPEINNRTWAWRQVDRIGQDKLVNRRSMQYFDSPPAPLPQIDRTWLWRQVDKIGFDTLPHRQQDWQNPVPPPRVDAYWARGFDWTRLTPRPTVYFDRPINPPSIDETWTWRQTRMLGQDTLPFRQQDWPNPVAPPQIDRTWTQGFSITLSTVTVFFPFNQYDWPNPAAPPRIDQFSGWSQTRMLGQDTLPFRQQDWPNPVAPPQIDRTWTQGFSLLLEVFVIPPQPHNQFDWPNPSPLPSIDHFWSQPLPLPLIPPPPAGTTVQLITSMGLFFNPGASAIP